MKIIETVYVCERSKKGQMVLNLQNDFLMICHKDRWERRMQWQPKTGVSNNSWGEMSICSKRRLFSNKSAGQTKNEIGFSWRESRLFQYRFRCAKQFQDVILYHGKLARRFPDSIVKIYQNLRKLSNYIFFLNQMEFPNRWWEQTMRDLRQNI